MFITCLTIVSFNYTFEITVIVYLRPLFIRIKMKKCYLLLLTCVFTRIIHFELVISYL